ncbi:MAG: hypothetical protein K2K60_02740 [Clostridia bacterium]|nr:hypothetical protein [Clostridia bacterium]
MEKQKLNYISVELSTGIAECGSLNFSDEVLDKSAQVLANILLDFVSNGGSTMSLMPSVVWRIGDKNE